MLDKKRGGRLQRDYTPQKATLQQTTLRIMGQPTPRLIQTTDYLWGGL